MSLRPWRFLLGCVILIGVAWGLRAPFLSRTQWSLDEGATFTMAEQVRRGAVLYRDAADNRNPLVPYLKAAVFAVAGDWNIHAVHLLIAIALGLVAILLWDLGRSLGHRATGFGAAIVFSLLAFILPGTEDGLAAHTEWFVIIFSSIGFALFARVHRNGGFNAGLLIGLAFGASALCKQPGLLDAGAVWLVIALLMWSYPQERNRLLRLWIGSVVGLSAMGAIAVLYFWFNGALEDFIYYAWTYNTKIYVPAIAWPQRLAGLRLIFELASRNAPFLGLLAFAGLIAAARDVWRSRQQQSFPLLSWLILGWFASGLVSTALSGRSFSHYGIQLIPALSLAGGMMLSRLYGFVRDPGGTFKWQRWAAIAVLTGIAFASLAGVVRTEREIVPVDDPNEARLFKLVQSHTRPDERLFVWGYFPDLYLMARRLPSTRFLYTNYLTGLIPWTNLDPLIDTRSAIVPDAWNRLFEDFARRPPALIIDTGSTRGYLKYPVAQQAPLWKYITENYAQVSVDDPDAMRQRLFRRLDRGVSTALPDHVDGSIEVSGFHSSSRHEPLRIHVVSPAHATQVELYAGNRCVATIPHPAEKSVNVLFFTAVASHPDALYRAVLSTPQGRRTSLPFDFSRYTASIADEPVPGPRIHVGNAQLRPRVANSPVAPIERTTATHWRIFAPALLEYDCSPEITKISFAHQLVEPQQMLSDGYDLVVRFTDQDGHSTPLLIQRLHPKSVGKDQLRQSVRLSLPAGHQRGRLTLQFLNGELNNGDADRIDVSDLFTEDIGPALQSGAAEIPATFAESSGHEAMAPTSNGRWSANTPARVEWPRPSGASSLTLHYGIEDGGFTAKDGHSDGVEFTVTLMATDGSSHVLFSQFLTPYHRPEHRGEQISHIVLPPEVEGRIVLTIGPGPQNDPTWDWAWIGPIRVEEQRTSALRAEAQP